MVRLKFILNDIPVQENRCLQTILANGKNELRGWICAIISTNCYIYRSYINHFICWCHLSVWLDKNYLIQDEIEQVIDACIIWLKYSIKEQFNICSTSVESSRVYTCTFIYTWIYTCSGFLGSGGKKISVNTSSLKLAELN